jgi:hypothetical protein
LVSSVSDIASLSTVDDSASTADVSAPVSPPQADKAQQMVDTSRIVIRFFFMFVLSPFLDLVVFHVFNYSTFWGVGKEEILKEGVLIVFDFPHFIY